MRKIILTAVAAGVLAAGAWYWWSPGLAMQGLKDAAIAGDKEELKERVDFPAVRESLKSQFKAILVAEMTKEKDNPFAALGMAFASAIVDPMIDAMISPDGIKAMVENGKMKDPTTQAEKSETTETNDTQWVIDRRGLDKFIAHPEAGNGDKGPSLVFKRDGLGWDLVDVQAPARPNVPAPAS